MDRWQGVAVVEVRHDGAMAATRIDLHTHSSASDGTVAPADLVAWAREVGLDVLALTDHDTFAGLDAAVEALPDGLTLVAGVELSTGFDAPIGRVSMHLLGYLMDQGAPGVAEQLEILRTDRERRAREMVGLMRQHGADVTFDQVQAIAGHGAVGRPHMAAALVSSGTISDYAQAWTPDWLATGGRCWVRKRSLEPADGVRLVLAAGGVPVVAHPGSAGRGHAVPDDVIAELTAAGLVGLEVDHPEHDAPTRARLRGLAADLGLLVTGSSDFHGSRKPNRLGQDTTDAEVFEHIVAMATGAQPITG